MLSPVSPFSAALLIMPPPSISSFFTAHFLRYADETMRLFAMIAILLLFAFSSIDAYAFHFMPLISLDFRRAA